jgi:hypothetical protein
MRAIFLLAITAKTGTKEKATVGPPFWNSMVQSDHDPDKT